MSVLVALQGGIEGSGGITFGEPAFSASGAETFTASAGITFAKPSFAGTGAESYTASGAITFDGPAFAGTGTEGFAGSAAVTIGHPSFAGDGIVAEDVDGTGGVTFGHPSLDGTGTGGAEEGFSIGHGPFGHVRLRREPLAEPPPRVYGSGGIAFAGPDITSQAHVTDDELVLALA